MKRKDFDQLIDSASFSELFIAEMGWDNPSNALPVLIELNSVQYDFVPVAEKSGFQVYKCLVDDVPTASECKQIDNKLRRFGYDYICVFVQNSTRHHLWLTPVKANEKRELVKTEYEGGAKADFLYSKMDGFSFDIAERVLISDVKSKVQGSFRLNSEEVTKAFYKQFSEQHKSFKKYIKGISGEKNIDWYASVMLNRLMFCYFVQKKGFLNFDTNYLRNKLEWVKEQQGADKFFGTFYKGFLCALFHDGLNDPKHDTPEFPRKYGRIPYLNGGMFDDHQLEREYKDIDISDEAFESLFAFFDKWNWHLDTRLTASGKDINPDVLGYIFEQYINDRASMGAYYTKEDITEYISKNCIIPFLMNKAEEKSKSSFKPDGMVWKMLRQSGDKYIYDAVKKGYSSDWQRRIPDYISKGIDTTTGNLLERRERWNEKSFEEFALPTEIWRETIERLQRCDTLLQKISNGEITDINDFITYNLDIRQFTEDVIRTTDDHRFVRHFYEALQSVTILDPTCGSGAFLFAALNILEPLYEACLDRMEEWNHSNPKLFDDKLPEIADKYGNNRQYFIYKSIILRNLYGVDIMVEATEIAKLRLFLKMVAVVDVDKHKDNLGLEPLPDIDFNIKCGNTLVGYATEEELNNALAFGDMFANLEFKEKIHSKMAFVSKAYNGFRTEQCKAFSDNASIKATKEELKTRLGKLNDLLNQHMYKSITGKDVLDEGVDLWYDSWQKSHQPFHWLAEFYQIIKGNGGFDVIIGNPPYVEYNSVKFDYKIEDYKTLSCGNLYAYVLERETNILQIHGKMGNIVPVSVMSTPGYVSLRKLLHNNSVNYYSSFNIHPCCLFEGAHPRLSIVLNLRNTQEDVFVTKYHKWTVDERTALFNKILYEHVKSEIVSDSIAKGFPKYYSNLAENILIKMKLQKHQISRFMISKNSNGVEFYYRRAFGAFILFYDIKPIMYDENMKLMNPTEMKVIKFSEKHSAWILSLYHSSLFYFFTYTFSDCRNINKPEIEDFIIDLDIIEKENKNHLISLSRQLSSDLQNNSKYMEYNYSSGWRKFQAFFPRLSKPIIDEIDKVLAKHYDFTEEELDFIINYDIKYRMGDELGNED